MPANDHYCLRCGAMRRANDAQCWLCRQSFAEQTRRKPEELPYQPQKPADGAGEGTYTITSLMLIMTLIAVCLGMVTVAPGLGILLGILSLPAFIRTAIVVGRKKREGGEVEAGSKITLFLASLGTVLLAGTAAVVVFFGTCAASCFGVAAMGNQRASGFNSNLFVFLLIVGACLGLFAGGIVLKLIWQRRTKS